ncbi:MAG: DUF2760 domain-containing protein [Acidobacteria bacterium]|nr:DUF2760 domain-containing protein [Acidobacteriota bacterium]
MGLGLAIKTFFALLTSNTLPDNLLKEMHLQREDLKKELPPASPSPAEQRKRQAQEQARSLQLLNILQRDARLIDFLSEDIKPYSDAQVGAAVRNLHESSQQTLKRYLKLEPVMDSTEGESVTVAEGFDPAAIKLIGNVTGKPPLKGILRHKGWQVTSLDLPALPENNDQQILAPAEVEIS